MDVAAVLNPSLNLVTQATKIPREKIDNSVIVVNTPDETVTTSKASNVSYNTHLKEKLAFKLNYLDDEKARSESHYAFITRC